MSSAKVTVDVNVSPNEVWQLIGGFGSLPDWVPDVFQSELADGGRVRHLHDAQGHTFVERLERYDSAAHSYSYSIVQSPIPVSNYLSTITVTPISGSKGSRVEWSGVFTPDGIGEKEAEEIFHGLYSTGLKALASRYASRKQ
jgi:polyketide cyclase/dehydrase/lipid transport protein